MDNITIFFFTRAFKSGDEAVKILEHKLRKTSIQKRTHITFGRLGGRENMFSSRGKDNKDLDGDGPSRDDSNGSPMLPQRYTPECPKRVWKAYHERQALLQGDRQRSRPVFVDSLVWGKLSAGKLTALIEKERNSPKRFVAVGPVGRTQERCCLTGAFCCEVLGKMRWCDAAFTRKICFSHSPGKVLNTSLYVLYCKLFYVGKRRCGNPCMKTGKTVFVHVFDFETQSAETVVVLASATSFSVLSLFSTAL